MKTTHENPEPTRRRRNTKPHITREIGFYSIVIFMILAALVAVMPTMDKVAALEKQIENMECK